jgi:hypothetical protein
MAGSFLSRETQRNFKIIGIYSLKARKLALIPA